MDRLRFYVAMAAAKLLRRGLKLAGREASYIPGELAVKICKHFLRYIEKPETFIAVTGTNGKTTVSNLITSVLTANGYDVANNGFGSNVQGGVASAFIANSTLTGKAKKKIAVMEVDERSSLLIYPDIAPDYFICNNIMRDSLKRNAHTEFIPFIINSALPGTAKVFLNGDDIICAHLAPQCKDRTYFGVDALRPAENDSPFVKDIVYCPQCGAKLEEEYIRYNHIGRMRCPDCGYGTPERDFLVTAVDAENKTFTVAHDGAEDTYHLINDNIVNIYNFCGAAAVLTRFGLSPEQIAKGFAASEIVKTRYDFTRSGDLNITMILAKGQNPIACARCFSYVAKRPARDKAVIVLVDDKGDNTNNSESVCWLYDCDYSFLGDGSIGQLVFAGPRCLDHVLRARMAGVAPDKIRTTTAPDDGARLVDTDRFKDIFVLYDPYLLDEAARLKRELVRKGKGGEG